MSQSIASNARVQERLGLGDGRLYLVTSAMVLGNVLLPYAFHQIPNGGRIFLPIFFFTLISGWRFGMAAGLITALLSPLASHLLTGMPATSALPAIILQSALLAVLAAVAAARERRTRVVMIALVVLVHQAVVLIPAALSNGLQACAAALQTRAPGLLLQVAGGFLLLRLLERLMADRSAPDHEP